MSVGQGTTKILEIDDTVVHDFQSGHTVGTAVYNYDVKMPDSTDPLRFWPALTCVKQPPILAYVESGGMCSRRRT